MKTHMSIRKNKKMMKKHYFDSDPVGLRKVYIRNNGIELHYRSSQEQIYHVRKKLAAKEAALNKIK